jgi:hypothetical protein
MNISVGDIVDFEVFRLALYACWGKSKGKIGFSLIYFFEPPCIFNNFSRLLWIS